MNLWSLTPNSQLTPCSHYRAEGTVVFATGEDKIQGSDAAHNGGGQA